MPFFTTDILPFTEDHYVVTNRISYLGLRYEFNCITGSDGENTIGIFLSDYAKEANKISLCRGLSLSDYIISTTIKRHWINEILNGIKTSEFKGNTDYWNKRLRRFIGHDFDINPTYINFLCGKMSYKFRIKNIILHATPGYIDGIDYNSYWQIVLWYRVRW